MLVLPTDVPCLRLQQLATTETVTTHGKGMKAASQSITKVFKCPYCGVDNNITLFDTEWDVLDRLKHECWYCHRMFFKWLKAGD
jgi:hypothetical protein